MPKSKSICWLAKIRAYQVVSKKFRYSVGLVTTNIFSPLKFKKFLVTCMFWLKWPIFRHIPIDSHILLPRLDFGMAKIGTKPIRLDVPMARGPYFETFGGQHLVNCWRINLEGTIPFYP